jgi:putative membrane protein
MVYDEHWSEFNPSNPNSARREGAMLGALWSFLVWLVVSALVIWIVGRMGMGIKVNSFGSAMIAALIISVVAAIVYWLLGLFGLGATAGLIGAIISLVIAAVIIKFSSAIAPGMVVDGWGGAFIAAIAIGVVSWLVLWLLSLFGINTAVL